MAFVLATDEATGTNHAQTAVPGKSQKRLHSHRWAQALLYWRNRISRTSTGYLHALGPWRRMHRTVPPDSSGGNGQYVVVVKGGLLHEGREHKALTVVLVKPRRPHSGLRRGRGGWKPCADFSAARVACH